MNEKTSITLSTDGLAGRVVEVQARDLQRINQAADRLNSEAAEVLDYQVSED
jgi:hypothetical protein